MIDLKKNMSYNFNDELCNIKNIASDTVRGSVYSTEGIDILSRNSYLTGCTWEENG